MEKQKLNLASLPTEILRQITHSLAPAHRSYWTASFQYDPSREYGRNRRWVHDIQALALASKRFCDIARAELFKIVMLKDHTDMDEFVNHASILTRPQVAVHVRVLIFSYGIMKEQKEVTEQWHPNWKISDGRQETLSNFAKQYIETTRSLIRATSQRLTNIGVIVYRPKSAPKPFKDYYSFTDVISLCMSEIRLPSLRCMGICGPRLATATRSEIVRNLPGNVSWPPPRPAPDSDEEELAPQETSKHIWSEESAKRQAKSTWLFRENIRSVKHIEYREDYWAKFHSRERGSVHRIIESYYPSEVLANALSMRLIMRAVESRDKREVDLAFLNNSRHLTSLSMDSVSAIQGGSLSSLIPQIPDLKSLTITYVCLDSKADRWDRVFSTCKKHLERLVTLNCNFVTYQAAQFNFAGQGKRVHLVSPYNDDVEALSALFRDIYNRRQRIGHNVVDTELMVKWEPCGALT